MTLARGAAELRPVLRADADSDYCEQQRDCNAESHAAAILRDGPILSERGDGTRVEGPVLSERRDGTRVEGRVIS